MKFKGNRTEITYFTLIMILGSQFFIPLSYSETGSYDYITKFADVYQRSSSLRMEEWFHPVHIDSDGIPELVGIIGNGIGAGRYLPEINDFEVIWEISHVFPEEWAYGDTDKDGVNELIIYSDPDDEILTGYDPKTGAQLWSQNLDGYAFRKQDIEGLEIVDWDNDGKNEILFGTYLIEDREPVIAVLENIGGSLELETAIPIEKDDWRIDVIHTCDLDGDGNTEILRPDVGLKLIEFGELGYSEFKIDFQYVASAVSGDVDGDGSPELVTVAKTHSSDEYSLYIHEYVGNNLVEISHLDPEDITGGYGVSCIGDFDGDSTTEIAYFADLGNDDPTDYHLTIVSLTGGQLIVEYQKSYTINRWCSADHVESVDMTDDGIPELVISGDYQTGILTYNPPSTEHDQTDETDTTPPVSDDVDLELYPTETEVPWEPETDLDFALDLENHGSDTAKDVYILLDSLDSSVVNLLDTEVMAGDIEPGSIWFPETSPRIRTGTEGSTVIRITVMGSNFDTFDHELTVNLIHEEPETHFITEWMKLRSPYNMGSMQVTGLTSSDLVEYKADWGDGDLFLKLYTSNAGNWMDVARYEFHQGKANLATSRKLGYFQTFSTILSGVYEYISFEESLSQAPGKIKTVLSYDSINELVENKDVLLSLVNDLSTIQSSISNSGSDSNWFSEVDDKIFKIIAAYSSGGFSLYTEVAESLFSGEVEDTSNRLYQKAFIHYTCGLHAEEIYTILSEDNPTEDDVEQLLYHAERFYTLKKLESLLTYNEVKSTWEHESIVTQIIVPDTREEKITEAENFHVNTVDALDNAIERLDHWKTVLEATQ